MPSTHRTLVTLTAVGLMALWTGCSATDDVSGAVESPLSDANQDGLEGDAGARCRDPRGRPPGPPSPEGFLAHFDADGDGSLQVSEVPPRMSERFEEVDADASGALSVAELTAHFEQRHTRRFEEADANGDGALTEDEVGARWRGLGRADTDGDGRVTRDELDQAFRDGQLGPRGPGGRHNRQALPRGQGRGLGGECPFGADP